ncbi:MAG: hypothetical protein U1E49_21735 [Hyphomicrobiaceae bacterium]
MPAGDSDALEVTARTDICVDRHLITFADGTGGHIEEPDAWHEELAEAG